MKDEISNFRTIKLNANKDDYPNIMGKHFSYDDLDEIRIAADIMMSPLECLDPSIETGITYMNSIKSNPEIEIYIPGLWRNFQNLDKSLMNLDFMTSLMYKGVQFVYVIYNCYNAEILGFIIVNTPTYNKITNNSQVWTIDFCLTKRATGYGIMSKALPNIFFLLKNQLNVDQVFFIVDAHNDKCINVLERVFAYREMTTYTTQDVNKKYPVQYFYKINLTQAVFRGFK